MLHDMSFQGGAAMTEVNSEQPPLVVSTKSRNTDIHMSCNTAVLDAIDRAAYGSSMRCGSVPSDPVPQNRTEPNRTVGFSLSGKLIELNSRNIVYAVPNRRTSTCHTSVFLCST